MRSNSTSPRTPNIALTPWLALQSGSAPGPRVQGDGDEDRRPRDRHGGTDHWDETGTHRSEEHTSELQSQSNLVCRLLLEKKKKTHNTFSATLQLRPPSHSPQTLI